MDMVSASRSKVSNFRIKELKDVLSQLGLARQGKKQDLVDRILNLLGDEHEPRLHDLVNENSILKERVAKVIDDTFRKMQVQGATDLASNHCNGPTLDYVSLKEEDSYKLDVKIRCPCGNPLGSKSTIKCEDPQCRTVQHKGCVIICEKPSDGVQPEIPPKFYCEICRINRADPFWVTMSHPLLPVKITSPKPTTDGTNTSQTVEKTFYLTRAARDLLQKTEYDLQVWCILLNDKVPFRIQWPQSSNLSINGNHVRTTNRHDSQLFGINGRDDVSLIKTHCKEGSNKVTFARCDARTFCFGVRIARRLTIEQVLKLVPEETEGEHFEVALARVSRCLGGGAAAENSDSDSDLEVISDSVTVNLLCPMSGSMMKIAARFKPCVHIGCFDLETFVELSQRSRKWQCPICLKNCSVENLIIDPYFNRIIRLLQSCGRDVSEVDVKPDGSWRVKNAAESDLRVWHSPDGTAQALPNLEAGLDWDPLGTKEEEDLGGHEELKLGTKRPRSWIQKVNPQLEDLMGTPLFYGNLPKFENPGDMIMPFDFSEDGQRPPAHPEVIVLSDSDDDDIPSVPLDTGYGSLDPFMATDPVDPDLGVDPVPPLDHLSNGVDFERVFWPLPVCSQTGTGFQFFDADSEASFLPSSSYGLPKTHSATKANHSLPAFVGDDPSMQLFLASQPNDLTRDSLPQQNFSDGNQPKSWISLRLGVDDGHPDGSSPFGARTAPPPPAATSCGSERAPIRRPRSTRPRFYLSIDSDSD
ncbi:unnamed protein product [Spirodela intermedia]|uniref:Uncharacterized protein n=1 Tax=Spirodela intermedia TaxID=51605 RepID=A0A7I8L8A2_SPIIN|nr:unnamed protein product [Spirodela intermedia]